MSSEDNSIKAQHGASAKKTLDFVVRELENYGALISHEDNPTYGYDGHDRSQFKADKSVTTFSGEKCLLFSTNSIRSDRVKGQQWDAHNIKRIDSRVEYAYIIIPDDDALEGSRRFRERMRNGDMVSEIDDIMTVEEFYEYEVTKFGESLGAGARHDLEGRKFEDLFCSILGNRENLNRYNGVGYDVGFLYEVFKKVMERIGVGPEDAVSIAATASIPKLPSGGSPKTDVVAKINLEGGGQRIVTFSLKDSSNTYVSVHQYSADDFSKVLDPDNKNLLLLLREFQRAHNARDMRDGAAEALKNELKPYLLDLDRWVFSGYGAPGVKPIQCAQFLVTKIKGTDVIDIHGIDEYCQKLESLNSGNSGFGTIFHWTYASGEAGKSIQLKARIIP